MAKPVIHKSKNGYVLCRTRKVDNKFIFGTEKDSDVTCKVCLAGGQSNFKRNQFKQYEIRKVNTTEDKQIKELIFAIGYTLDAIDVRANDLRRFEAKQKAKRILERLASDLSPKPADKETNNASD